MKITRGVALGCVAAALAVIVVGAASATDTGPVASGGVTLAYQLTADGSTDTISGGDDQTGVETFSASVSNVSDDGGDSSLDDSLTLQNPTITATGSLDQLDPPLTSPDVSTAGALAPGDSLELSDFDSSQLDSASFQTGVDVSRTIQTLSCADTDQCIADDQLGSIDYSSCPALGSLDGASDGDTIAAGGDTLEIVTVSVGANGTSATGGTLSVSSASNAGDASDAGLTPTLIGCDLSDAGGGDATAEADTASISLPSLDSVSATFVFQIANGGESDVQYKPEVDFSTDTATDDTLDTTDTSADVTVADLGGDVEFSADNQADWQLTRQSTVAVSLGGLVDAGGGSGGGEIAPDGDGAIGVDPTEVGASTTGNTLTFDYVPDGDLSNGMVTLRIPDGWSAPSITSTDEGAVSATAGDLDVVGRTISLQNVTMSAGDDLTIVYGDQTDGGPGATAPIDAGDFSFDAKEASTALGTLTDLAESPEVTVDPVPQIDSVSDTTQDPNGMVGVVGDSVVITGSGFSTVSEVDFNGTSADLDIVSDSEIDTTVPDGATTGPVSVANVAGTVSADADFIVAVTPSISTVTAVNGAVPGKTATINGAHLNGTKEVDFGGVAATTFNVVSNSKVTATIPAGAKTGKVKVVNPAGSASSASTFYIAPAITGFNPPAAPAGTSITITGTNLLGSTAATINGKSAAITFTGTLGTSLKITVPSGATTGKIAVTNPGGTGVSGQSFTVIVKPAVAGFTPKAGPAGTTVAVTGSGFAGVTEVDFGGVAGTALNVVDDGHLSVKVPAGGRTGPILAQNAAGSGASASAFTVYVKPAISSFTPKSGVPGTPVTITGTGFTGVSEVDFGSASANGGNLSVSSDTSLTVTVPADAVTGKVAVINPAGSGVSVGTFTFVPPTPTITSISPKSGAVGALLTINGTNMAGASQVTFGGGVTASPASSTATKITVNVPANAITGKLTVTNNGKTSSASSDTFMVIYAKPTISSLSASSGTAGVTITVNGTHLNGVQDPNGGGATIQGVAATVTYVSDKQIKVAVPAGAPGGAGLLVVTNTAGSASVAFTVLPAFTSFSASSAKAGTTIKINGTGLKAVASVKFTGGVTATPTATTGTSVTVVIPKGAKTGTVTVIYPGGQTTSSIVLTITS